MKTRLQVLFTVVLLLLPLPSWSSQLLDGGYDAQFQRYWSRYIPQHDYGWGIAQCYQESLLDERAVSPAGAIGLCQFMPPTFDECIKRLNIQNASPYVAELSIICNAWYMSTLLRIWKADRERLARLELAQASYNAGAGNIIRSQKLCGGMVWDEIQPCLVQVTGRNARETTTYIERIARWFRELQDARTIYPIYSVTDQRLYRCSDGRTCPCPVCFTLD